MSGMDRHHQVMLVLKRTQLEEDYSKALTSSGHTVTTVNSTQEARAAMRRDPYDVMVIDASVEADHDGLDFAHEVLQLAPRPEVIVLVARPDVKQAVAFTKAGGFDYVAKPLPVAQVLDLVRQAGRSRSAAEPSTHDTEGFDDFLRAFMVSSVPEVQEMAALCRTVAARPESTALIVGEPGVGKGVVTRIIHWLSQQSRGPLVVLNVVDVDPFSLERTLFGTGSGDDGLLASAQGGTLVLREVGEVESSIQVKLKRLLETRSYQPVGGAAARPFHGRVLGTSAWDVERLVRQHGVDAGFGYLFGSVTITVPPLRDRAEDLPRITEAIFAQVSNDASRPDLHLTPAALQLVFDHPWAGNLRELRNVLTRLALLCPDDEVDADALARALGFPSAEARRSHSSGVTARVRGGSTLPRRSRSSSVPVPRISGIIAEALDEPARAERDRIEGALDATDGHRERAAAILGMSRTTLWTRMRMLGIECDRFHTPKAKAQ